MKEIPFLVVWRCSSWEWRCKFMLNHPLKEVLPVMQAVGVPQTAATAVIAALKAPMKEC